MNPLFSIIVASYNYASLIGETLDSLLAQTYQDYEIIVVDDGSSDDSLTVISNYMKQSDKIKLYTHPDHQNKGLIETIKLGIQMSRGEYVAFCESDDLWMPEHLEEKAKVIQENNGKVFIISNDVEVFGEPESTEIRKGYVKEIKEKLSVGANPIFLDNIGDFNVIPTFSCVTIKKWLFNYIDFNSPIPAWVDFWIYRQILQRYDLYFLPQKLTRWRMHDSYNDPTKAAEYTKRSKDFMEKSNQLVFYPQDKYLFTMTKDTFHHSKSWSETVYFLKLYQKVSHDKKLVKKIRSKFVWYRILQFWRNHSWKKYTVQSINYSSFLPSDTSYKKKILLFSHEMSLTGAPRALCALAEVLKKNGLHPVIMSPSSNEMEEETDRLGIPVIADSLLELKLYQRDKTLYKFINSFDMLFFNTISCLHYALYLPNLKQKKVAWIHEGETSFRLNPSKDIQEAFSLLDDIYTVGEYSKSFALPYTSSPEKIKTLLYGCPDIATSQEAGSHGDTVPQVSKKLNILIIGTIDRRKGMHLINKALEEMAPTTLDKINVTIIGPSVSKSITASLKKSKYKCLHYLGQKSHQEVVSILHDSDILLCPSLDDPMPIVCTEAMMLQKVIIVSDHTGTASFIRNGENGFIISAGSPQAIASAIETAIKQRGNFARIGKEARKIYEQNFTMEVFEKNIQEIFDN